MIVPEAACLIRQAAFDATVCLGSGKHGRFRFALASAVGCAESNAADKDCKIRVTKFDVYVKRRSEAAQRRMVLRRPGS
jgi:hypothetical protein